MDEENAYTSAESAAFGFSGKVVHSGFLTTESITSSGNGWSHSYFVLAGTSKENARLYRFLSPNDTKPQDHIRIASMQTNIHGEALLLRSQGTQYLTVPPNAAARDTWLQAVLELKGPRDGSSDEADADPNLLVDVDRREGNVLPLFLDAPGIDPVARAQVEESDVLRRECCVMEIEQLKRLLFSGGLWNSTIRSICWRRMLGVLPEDREHWRAEVARQRSRYEGLKRSYLGRSRHDEEKENVDTFLERKVVEVCLGTLADLPVGRGVIIICIYEFWIVMAWDDMLC